MAAGPAIANAADNVEIEQWYIQSQQNEDIAMQGTYIDLSPAPGQAVLTATNERITRLEDQVKRNNVLQCEMTARQLAILRGIANGFAKLSAKIDDIQDWVNETDAELPPTFDHLQWIIVCLIRLAVHAGQDEASTLEQEFIDGCPQNNKEDGAEHAGPAEEHHLMAEVDAGV